MPRQKEGKARGTDPDEQRRRREDHTVQIRKNRQIEQIAKHRKVRGHWQRAAHSGPCEPSLPRSSSPPCASLADPLPFTLHTPSTRAGR